MRNNSRKIRIAMALVILMLCSLFLTSCKAGLSDADDKVKDMCAALAEDDFEKAVGLMHPSVGLTADSLRDSISDIEKKCGIDFSSGVEFTDTVAKSSYLNVQIPAGVAKTMSIQYKIAINGLELDLYTVVVSDSEGFGIYNFTVQNRGTVA